MTGPDMEDRGAAQDAELRFAPSELDDPPGSQIPDPQAMQNPQAASIEPARAVSEEPADDAHEQPATAAAPTAPLLGDSPMSTLTDSGQSGDHGEDIAGGDANPSTFQHGDHLHSIQRWEKGLESVALPTGGNPRTPESQPSVPLLGSPPAPVQPTAETTQSAADPGTSRRTEVAAWSKEPRSAPLLGTPDLRRSGESASSTAQETSLTTVRSVPLQRFLDPGAAAVATGAAHYDADGSVVFRPFAHFDEPAGANLAETADTGAASSPAAPAPWSPAPPSREAPWSPTPLGSTSSWSPAAPSPTSGWRQPSSPTGHTSSSAPSHVQRATDQPSATPSLSRAVDNTSDGWHPTQPETAWAPTRTAFQNDQRSTEPAPQPAPTAPELQAVQTFADVATQTTPDAAVQTTWANPAETVQMSESPDVTVQTAAAPAPAAPGGAGALPTDLDELARRLFDPLAARIKAELWLDRERAGSVLELHR